MTDARPSLIEVRHWIDGEVAQVEALIHSMPDEQQASYRASSFPHAALRVIDNVEKLIVDLGENSESGYRRALVYFPEAE